MSLKLLECVGCLVYVRWGLRMMQMSACMWKSMPSVFAIFQRILQLCYHFTLFSSGELLSSGSLDEVMIRYDHLFPWSQCLYDVAFISLEDQSV